MTLPAPTFGEEAQLAQAIVATANRQLQLVYAALGVVGESEFGVIRVGPPRGIDEVLYGLRMVPEWEVEDLAGLVTTDDVIRAGGLDPSGFPADRIPDVQRAIDSSAQWVRNRVWGAHGVA